jgi:hypothetical protein
MRKRLLGSIAALAAGAGTAWGQPPVASPGPSGADIAPAPPLGGPPRFGGLPGNAIPGNAGFAPPPAIMPPGNYGPPGDPLGLGPVGGFGPPPSPNFPMPGPYAQQSYQPAPPGAGNGLGGRGGDLGYGTAPRWWVEGEYLLWFTDDQPINSPLLTTSAPNDAGLPGAASTTVLVGNRDINYGVLSGFRLNTGFFGDADRRFGFNLGLFFTEQKGSFQDFGGAGNSIGIPLLARPFIDAATGAQSSLVLGGPDFGPASASFGTRTQTYSIEPSAVWNLYRSQPGCRMAWSLDFLAGYRYLEVKESIFLVTRTDVTGQFALPTFTTGPFGVITQTGVTTLIPAQGTFGGVNLIAPTAVITSRDNFSVRNKFNGASFGLRGEGRYGMVTTSAFAKVAIGNLNERLEVFGGGTLLDTSGRSGSAIFSGARFNSAVPGRIFGSSLGGLLAANGQIGTFDRDRFSAIPEFGGNVGIALTGGLTAHVGVNFLYVPDLIRPGNQINGTLNSAAVPFSPNFGAPGAPRTGSVVFDESDFWIGGVNFGLTLKY